MIIILIPSNQSTVSVLIRPIRDDHSVVQEKEQSTRELEELRREVRQCRENHQANIKRDPEETHRPSTSRVKREPGVKAEYFEHGDEDIDIDLT